MEDTDQTLSKHLKYLIFPHSDALEEHYVSLFKLFDDSKFHQAYAELTSEKTQDLLDEHKSKMDDTRFNQVQSRLKVLEANIYTTYEVEAGTLPPPSYMNTA